MKLFSSISAALVFALSVLAACSTGQTVKVSVGEDTISHGFIGNGVEWDPYDEARSWGSEVSEADWETLRSRLEWMRPGYVRCMINSPYKYYDAATGKYVQDKDINDLCNILDYCRSNGITVVFGEFNPPAWEMKDSPEWVKMSVDYLEYLVCGLGYDCIKYFIIFNEPDGNWASTNGDFSLWSTMLQKFASEIGARETLAGKISFAAPDVVLGYHNNESEYDALGWVSETVSGFDSLTGVYDIHSYPSQSFVRSGEFKAELDKFRRAVPSDKKIILGEAGFKYRDDPRDAPLQKAADERVIGHKFTKGMDSNMLVYDKFYGLDMAMLAMDVMNSGFSGAAAWMLDDAMHSCGDSGKTEDIKIWGMWNILGSEVFNSSAEEDIRPWYYAWSLMCRFFPSGCDILRTGCSRRGIKAAAAVKDGKKTLAVLNVRDRDFGFKTDSQWEDVKVYVYCINDDVVLSEGDCVPDTIKAQSLMVITEMD